MFESYFLDPRGGPWFRCEPWTPRSSIRWLRRSTGRGPRGPQLEDADRELLAVHRRELARLLLLAAGEEIRRGRNHPALATYPLEAIPLRAWRQRARRALHLVALDRLDLPVADAVRTLLARPRRGWLDPDTLTSTAMAHGAGAIGELCHAHALLVQGRPGPAAEHLRSLLDRDPPDRIRWRAYEGLAAAHEEEGRLLLACGAMEAAAEDPACGVGPLASGLYLALCLGDEGRSRRAAARLDLLVRPDEPDFLATLTRLRNHRAARNRVRIGEGVPVVGGPSEGTGPTGSPATAAAGFDLDLLLAAGLSAAELLRAAVG